MLVDGFSYFYSNPNVTQIFIKTKRISKINYGVLISIHCKWNLYQSIYIFIYPLRLIFKISSIHCSKVLFPTKNDISARFWFIQIFNINRYSFARIVFVFWILSILQVLSSVQSSTLKRVFF